MGIGNTEGSKTLGELRKEMKKTKEINDSKETVNFSVKKVPDKDDLYVIILEERVFHHITGNQMTDINAKLFVNGNDLRHLIDVMNRVLLT